MLKKSLSIFTLAAFVLGIQVPTNARAQQDEATADRTPAKVAKSKKSKKKRSAKNSKRAKAKEPSILPDAAYARKQLEAEGFSPGFIKQVMKTYESKGYEEVLRLNTILYLKKSDYHGIQVTEQATKEVRQFSEKNKVALQKAEAAYKVPAEVIASLLFIESRFGKTIGNYHIPSVYLHIIQAPKKSVQEYLLSQTHRYTDAPISDEVKTEILARTERKATWAMGELHALEKVYDWKWNIGKKFRGSFSGAFGMPQFLPSSYIKWSRSMNPPAQPNLDDASDAIQSVGHYLSDHGWKTEKADSQVPALMKYNNSKDYAKAILALAEKLDARSVASDGAAPDRASASFPTKE